MFDLQVLAYQCDLTRVITFMVGREFSGRSYPQIGVPDAHHPLSHHQYDPDKVALMAKLNTYHASLLAYYLDKLQSTKEGDGSLLDHVLLIYGAGMSDSNSHDPRNLPILLFGGAGQLKGRPPPEVHGRTTSRQPAGERGRQAGYPGGEGRQQHRRAERRSRYPFRFVVGSTGRTTGVPLSPNDGRPEGLHYDSLVRTSPPTVISACT